MSAARAGWAGLARAIGFTEAAGRGDHIAVALILAYNIVRASHDRRPLDLIRSGYA